jgi:hypothetical protein
LPVLLPVPPIGPAWWALAPERPMVLLVVRPSFRARRSPVRVQFRARCSLVRPVLLLAAL